MASDGTHEKLVEVEQLPSKSRNETGGQMRAAVGVCIFAMKVDNPHISTFPTNTTTLRAVQAHGAWRDDSCGKARANVKTQLDRRGFLNQFFAVGTQGTGFVKSSAGRKMPTGSSYRVTARYVCKGRAGADFRAWTDVDVPGWLDTPAKIYSNETCQYCG